MSGHNFIPNRDAVRSYMAGYMSRGGMSRGGPAPPPRSETPRAAPRQTFRDASGKELRRPAIQGYACLYNVAFSASGKLRYMKSGAFINSICDSSKTKRLLFDHDDTQELGSTKNGLEFANCLKGLAFRMPLDGNANAGRIISAVNNNERACVSVGGEFTEYEKRHTDDGVEYLYCSQMRLDEISLVPEGAVTRTYCRVVDLDDEEPNLWLAARKATFETDQSVANLTARAKRLVDKLAKLKA